MIIVLYLYSDFAQFIDTPEKIHYAIGKMQYHNEITGSKEISPDVYHVKRITLVNAYSLIDGKD